MLDAVPRKFQCRTLKKGAIRALLGVRLGVEDALLRPLWVQGSPRLLLGSGSLYPLPRRARFPRLCQFWVNLRVAGGGTQAFAGFARVNFEFVADGLECHDIGHVDHLDC